MSLRLDTHSVLWFGLDDPRLGEAGLSSSLDPAHETLVSPATDWEIASKIRIGKYAIDRPY